MNIQIRKTIGNPRKLGAKVALLGITIGRNCLVKGLVIGNNGFSFVSNNLYVSYWRVL